MIKLIALFALLLIIAVIIWAVTPDYEKCYSDMEYEGYASMGCCGGLTGGTKDTDYLSETCYSCPHLVLGCNPIREVKDKMSKVIIISSLSQENEIKKVADYYKKLGYLVDYPIKQSDKEFSRIVEDYLYRISLSDIVVAITKSDGTFGTGVTYELAFARYLNKRIVVITDLDGGCLND